MSLQAVFVDESSTDLKLARRLTRGGMRTEGWHPGGSIESLVARVAQATRKGECDILLLDYRLDEEPDEAGVRARFRGGTVAAALREKAPELPVVLVTTVAKLEENLEQNWQVRSLFDHEIMKGELQDYRHRPHIIEELADLAAGFETATTTVSRARTGNQWTVLGRLIGVEGTELQSLEKAVSQPLPKPGYLVARWLLHELLQFSGPLLPEEETATRLGLTLEGFRRATVRNWASRASYRGVFSVLRERWWRSRIDSMIRSLGIEDNPLSARARARAITRAIGTTALPSARCTWCRRDEVTRACSICHEAVDATHCLAVSADYRPPWAEVPVACFTCIQTGRAEEVTFMPGAGSTLELLRAGKLRGVG